MMKSIKLKLVFIYLALVFIVMIVSGTFMLTNTKITETNKARDRLKIYIDYINDSVIMNNEESAFNELIRSETHSQQGFYGIEGNILNARGATIASTLTITDAYVDTSILAALDGKENFTTGKDLDKNTSQYREYFNYAYPVMNADTGAVKYIIFVRMDAQYMYNSLLQQGMTLLLTIALVLVLTAILGFLFASTLTDPIIELTKKSREIASGQLNQEIEVRSTDEIGQLTESFNFMVTELHNSISSLTSEKSKIEIIQHNMSDGVLAYDRAGKLIHANFAAQELLNVTDIESVPFDEMMRILSVPGTDEPPKSPAAFLPFLTDGIKDTGFQLGDKFVNASFSPYLGKDEKIDGLVIVLQDITRHKKLDDMRKEFVANVSHEIRTPLTTIKSYAETLLDGAMDDDAVARDFLAVINSETDRMTLLVKDLLELTRFDSKQLKMEMQEIELLQLLKKSIGQSQIFAEKKCQTIVYDIPDTEFITMADPSRINQVFTNVITNAIKYTNDGGEINIYTEETGTSYRIYIRDSGIGIPKEDLPRIFERFYRVDKARSRAMGGTGLGLAIAREIMEAHGGKILATSELGRGTTMVLRFPKDV